MRRAVLEQQALLPGAPERRPVRVGGAEVRVPGVEVRVEVQQGDRAVAAVHRPEQRQGDRVVAADRQEMGRRVQRLVRGGLDLRDRLRDVERVARHVAGVGDLLRRERMDVECGVVRAQEPAWRCGPRADRTALPAGRSRRCRRGCRGRRRRRPRRPRDEGAGRRSRDRRTEGRRAGSTGPDRRGRGRPDRSRFGSSAIEARC